MLSVEYSERLVAEEFVYIPAHGGHEAKWTTIADCLWEAPQIMRTKHPLKYLYQRVLQTEQIDLVAHFFGRLLLVESVSWEHLIDELRHTKELVSDDFDHILSLYRHLVETKAPDHAARIRSVLAFWELSASLISLTQPQRSIC